jgi:hypothetical protein
MKNINLRDIIKMIDHIINIKVLFLYTTLDYIIKI